MRALSKKQSRGLAMGLLILFLTIGVLLLLIPINMLHRHYDQSLDSLADYLGRYRHVVATHAEVQSALDQVKKKMVASISSQTLVPHWPPRKFRKPQKV